MPRNGDAATGVDGRAGAEDVGAETAGAAAAIGAFAGASACTSSFRILPPIPVPLTDARFTPRSLASLRTIGVT